MEFKLFRSLWTTSGDLGVALADVGDGVFDGIEGPVPLDAAERRRFLAALGDVPLVAEISTAGDYVPDFGVPPARHLEDFRRKAEVALEARPLFLTVLAGSDAWSLAQSVEFFGAAMAIAAELGIEANFETHRSRSFFHPWITRDVLAQLPELWLTGDFSHWCCVTERLILDYEPELLARFATRTRHLHGRIGYEQGAQVPHPAAPEYRDALAAHERWWDAVWNAQESGGAALVTMTAEAGPDGYLHTLPFTNVPVADLRELNRWMAVRQRERFAARHKHAALPTSGST
jgi:hypothetical protein